MKTTCSALHPTGEVPLHSASAGFALSPLQPGHANVKSARQTADSRIYSTVLKDKAVKTAVKEAADGGYANVQGINETASFRCMGCYAFEINVLVSEGEQLIEKVLEVRTQATGPQKVKVSSVTLK